jgi:hypothetical protein
MERKSIGVLINVLGRWCFLSIGLICCIAYPICSLRILFYTCTHAHSLAINLGNNLQSSGHRNHKSGHEENESELDKLNSKHATLSKTSSNNNNSSSKYNFTTQPEVDVAVDAGDDNDDEENNRLLSGESSTEADERETDFMLALLDCSGGQFDKTVSQSKKHKTHSKQVTSAASSTHPLSWLKCHCNKWLIGTCFFLSGTIAVFVSYSFAPQSLIAPLGSVQFVSNMFFAKLIHKSPITRRMLVATSVILMVGFENK